MPHLRLHVLILVLGTQVAAWAPLRPLVAPPRRALSMVAKESAERQSDVAPKLDWTILSTAEALGMSEADTMAFVQGRLSPKKMSVSLLRRELDMRGYASETEMCECAKDLRDLLLVAREREEEDEPEMLRNAKKQSAEDKELVERYLALENEDRLPGYVDIGELAPAEDLPPDLLLRELQLRSPAEAEAFVAEDANYSAEELKWALLEARDEKALVVSEANDDEEGEDEAGFVEQTLSEMSVREMLTELAARGALEEPKVLSRKPLLEAVRSKRQSGQSLSESDMNTLQEEQTLFLHLKRAQTWDVVQRTHLDMLPDQANILADTWEILLRQSGLLSSTRRYSDLRPDDVLDNIPVDITLEQYQSLSFDSRVDVAVNDPVVAKVMKMINEGNESEAMEILEREPAAQIAFHEFVQALEEAGLED